MLALIVLCLTSCSHVEDTNGPDDYSIVTFSDEDYLSGGHYVISERVSKGSSYINNELKGIFKAHKISGIQKKESGNFF